MNGWVVVVCVFVHLHGRGCCHYLSFRKPQALAVRQRMLNFVQNFQYYTMFEVIIYMYDYITLEQLFVQQLVM